MQNRILRDTLTHLGNSVQGRKFRVTELHLTRSFTVVALEDGSVGAAMSYYQIPEPLVAKTEQRLVKHISDDPFFTVQEAALHSVIEHLVPNESWRHLIIASLMTSVASALSAPFISRGGDSAFAVVDDHCSRCIRNWSMGAEKALVIGYGGYFVPLIVQTDVKTIHVSDLDYELFPFKRRRIDQEIMALRHQFPLKAITAGGKLQPTSMVREFDLICITGSTLCNGTLEELLGGARKDSTVILQGQSASVHPKILFDSGIKYVTTTLKPGSLCESARLGDKGNQLRQALEGWTPWIHLLPPATQQLLDANSEAFR
jgi:hypothetical protein